MKNLFPIEKNEMNYTTVTKPVEQDSSFKKIEDYTEIVKNKKIHSDINGGFYGKYKIGKIITIFLDDESIIESLTKRLLELTTDYTGPEIFTDFPLGNI